MVKLTCSTKDDRSITIFSKINACVIPEIIQNFKNTIENLKNKIK